MLAGFEVNPWFILVFTLSLVFIIAYYVVGVRHAPSHAFTAVLIYSIFSKYISVVFLDYHSVLITESLTVSKYTGAWIRAALLCLMMLVGVYVSQVYLTFRERRADYGVPYLKPPSDRLIRISIYFLLFVLFLHYVNLVVTGKLALPGSEADHFNYWDSYGVMKFLPMFFGEIIIFYSFMCAALIYWGVRRSDKLLTRVGVALTLLYIVYLVFIGQRFHGLLYPMCMLFGTFIIWTWEKRRRVFDLRLLMILIGLGLLLIVYIQIDFQYRGVSQVAGGAAEGVLYRIFVLQGHTYWNMDYMVRFEGAHGGLKVFLNGVDSVMRAIASERLYENMTNRGVRFANMLPVTGIYVIGYFWTGVLMFVMGLIYGMLCYGLHRAIRHGRILHLAPLSFIMYWFHGSFSSGGFELMVSPKFVIMVVILCAMISFDRILVRERRMGRQPLGTLPAPAE